MKSEKVWNMSLLLLLLLLLLFTLYSSPNRLILLLKMKVQTKIIKDFDKSVGKILPLFLFCPKGHLRFFTQYFLWVGEWVSWKDKPG